MSEVVYINKAGVHSHDGKRAKTLSHPVKTDDERKREFQKWSKLKPVYFQTWVWQELCKKLPDRYKMFMPEYLGQRVILT